jgi:hypothetical protein
MPTPVMVEKIEKKRVMKISFSRFGMPLRAVTLLLQHRTLVKTISFWRSNFKQQIAVLIEPGSQRSGVTDQIVQFLPELPPMIFYTGMQEFVKDDVGHELLRKMNQIDVQTNVIIDRTTSPTRFLFTDRHVADLEPMSLRQGLELLHQNFSGFFGICLFDNTGRVQPFYFQLPGLCQVFDDPLCLGSHKLFDLFEGHSSRNRHADTAERFYREIHVAGSATAFQAYQSDAVNFNGINFNGALCFHAELVRWIFRDPFRYTY